MMIGHRQRRILTVLEAYPRGLAAENLLAAVCPPGDRVERHRTLRALYALANGGRISVTGKRHRTEVASALVALTDPGEPTGSLRSVPPEALGQFGGL